jgi:TonB family protein
VDSAIRTESRVRQRAIPDPTLRNSVRLICLLVLDMGTEWEERRAPAESWTAPDSVAELRQAAIPAPARIAVQCAPADLPISNQFQPSRHTLRHLVSPILPVEIISKPKPVYTEEARKRGIEGEVVLEVIFEASAQTRVVRVLRGLGHGLDEAAIQAASQIRFRPARRDGNPVDTTAIVHIVFEIA